MSTELKLTDEDKKLLMELEYNFPYSKEPYKELEDRLGIPEDQILNRVKELIRLQAIKRIGMYVNFRAKGLESALVGLNVNENDIQKFKRITLGIREITHNYIRDHPYYNVWIVIKEPTLPDIEKKILELKNNVAIEDYIILYSKKTLKLNVKFDIINGISWSQYINKEELNAEQYNKIISELNISQEFLKTLSLPLPLTNRPFKQISEKFNLKEDDVVNIIKTLAKYDIVRDYGATLNGEKLGIVENAMVLISSDNIEKACNDILYNVPEATHIVLREANKQWDYLCYFMIHGKDRRTIMERVKERLNAINIKSYMMLFSKENLKPGIVM